MKERRAWTWWLQRWRNLCYYYHAYSVQVVQVGLDWIGKAPLRRSSLDNVHPAGAPDLLLGKFLSTLVYPLALYHNTLQAVENVS